MNHVQQTRPMTHAARRRTTESVSDYRDSTVLLLLLLLVLFASLALRSARVATNKEVPVSILGISLSELSLE